MKSAAQTAPACRTARCSRSRACQRRRLCAIPAGAGPGPGVGRAGAACPGPDCLLPAVCGGSGQDGDPAPGFIGLVKRAGRDRSHLRNRLILRAGLIRLCGCSIGKQHLI